MQHWFMNEIPDSLVTDAWKAMVEQSARNELLSEFGDGEVTFEWSFDTSTRWHTVRADHIKAGTPLRT
jgi:hypothetical protein